MTECDVVARVRWSSPLLGWSLLRTVDGRWMLAPANGKDALLAGHWWRVRSRQGEALGLPIAGSLERCSAMDRDGRALFALDFAGNDHLEALPPRLSASCLRVARCNRLVHLRADLRVEGVLDASGCRSLETLGGWVGPVNELDLRDCRYLASLPAALVVRRRLEIGGLALAELPPGCLGAQLCWRDLPIEARYVVGDLTDLDPGGVLEDRVAPRREARLERIGMLTLSRHCDGTRVDADEDPGGTRELLRYRCADGSKVAALFVRCPSTGDAHALRVPPQTETCRQAGAWLAGFEPDDRVSFVAQT